MIQEDRFKKNRKKIVESKTEIKARYKYATIFALVITLQISKTCILSHSAKTDLSDYEISIKY